MVEFWVTLLAISILLYVLLDGFDLGVGMLFGWTRNESERHAMIMAVAPIWDGKLRSSFGAPSRSPIRYCCPPFTCRSW
jgi:hypothetical protein